jgi:hypothetical protein
LWERKLNKCGNAIYGATAEEFCMKNSVKLFGVIALVAVIGFLATACPTDDNDSNGGNPGGGGGTLTLTGIPSEYNGKYAAYSSVTDLPYLMGAQSLNVSTGVITAVQISNGSVSLPMWVAGNSGYTRFSGNRTVGDNNNMVLILNTATFSPSANDALTFKEFQSITFSNGNASISWSNTSGGGGGNGTFTLSGIPSTHNGKYAFLYANTSTGNLAYGCQSGNTMTGVFTLSPISGGSCNLPMWLVSNTDGSLSRYSGNDTFSVNVTLSPIETVDLNDSGGGIGTITFTAPIAFTSGSASRAWSAGTYTGQ